MLVCRKPKTLQKEKSRGTEVNTPSKKQLLATLLFKNKQIHICFDDVEFHQKLKWNSNLQKSKYANLIRRRQ